MTPTLIAILLALSVAHAEDHGQFDGYDLNNKQKQWFGKVLDTSGTPCCGIADGYPVDYKILGGHYWVLFKGEWHKVPPTAVIRKFGNPIGVAIAWFMDIGGNPEVRCFVPGPEG